jgi:hypothetical protein
MTKRNLLLASLLLVLGLGVMAPFALAQGGEGTVFNVNPSLYTLRPNSIGDAGGQIYVAYSSGVGIIAGGEIFTVTFSKPIVGAAGIALLPQATAAVDFCDDSTAGAMAGYFCSNMSYSAAGNVLILTNQSHPLGGGVGGIGGPLAAGSFITIKGLRFDTVGVPPGTFITASVGAVLNQNYPLSFGQAGITQTQTPVNIGQVATTSLGGTVEATLVYSTSILTCFGSTGSTFEINVAEQWAGAWTSLSDEMFLAPYAPTQSLGPTNGSDISITFSGIPLGVTVTPGIEDEPGVVTSEGTVEWGTYYPLAYTGVKANDTATFEYPIAGTERPELEAANFYFTVTTTGAIPLQSPPMTASVTLNPMTPVVGVYPAFTYPNGPLLEEPYYPLTVVDFIGCQTNLLFPYVTNYTSSSGTLGNWDTGIVVSNTSSDPYTEDFGGAIPTAGTCAFSVYASTTGSLTPSADAAPWATFNTAPVYTGGIDAFLLSQTSAKGLVGGYAIAVCNFLNGTGYAQVVDNANGLGNWGVMGSYLAYVIPNPFEEPRWLDSIFGEFAISPWFDANPAVIRNSVKPTSKMRAPSLKK